MSSNFENHQPRSSYALACRHAPCNSKTAAQPVNSVDDYDRLIREAGKESLVLLVNRGGATTFVVVEAQ